MARLARSLEVLRGQIDAAFPRRDRTHDGWIGDKAHAGRKSDHNPDASGVVRALDITHDPAAGCNAGEIAQAIHESRDSRVRYLIFNRRIANSSAIGGHAPWAWRGYTGSNPHTSHLHVSVRSAGTDDAAPWQIGKVTPVPEGKEHYDRKIFFDAVRVSPFPDRLTQQQVDGMNAFLDAWEPMPFTDRRWLAYSLGTHPVETGWTMQPVEEYGHGGGRDYGRPHPVTGLIYYGRGWVQLTHYDNYLRATNEINSRNLVGRKVDLVNEPDQALEPGIAAAVQVYGTAEGWFTGHKLPDYFAGEKSDWVNARRIVNRLDRANEIAAHAQAFFAALSKAATVQEPAQEPAMPEADPAGPDPVLAALKAQIKDRTGAREIHLVL